VETEVVSGLEVKSTASGRASPEKRVKVSFPWNAGDLPQILCPSSCQAAANLHASWLLHVPGCQTTRRRSSCAKLSQGRIWQICQFSEQQLEIRKDAWLYGAHHLTTPGEKRKESEAKE